MHLLHAVVSAVLAFGTSPFASQAGKLYKQGQKAERSGEMARAYLLYSEAAALKPDNRRYWLRSQAVRTRAALQALPSPMAAGAASDDPAADSAPETDRASVEAISDRDLEETRKPQPPQELRASAERKSFDLRGDAKSIWEQVTRAYGLDTVFDGEYKAGPVVRFRMDDAAYDEALHALEAATSSFLVPLSPRLMLVVMDTPQKRVEAEPTVSVVVPIPQPVTLQEAQEMARAVQQTMEIKRFAIDSTRRIVLINDRVSKVRPAQRLFEDLLYSKPEVAVEMEFMEVSRNDVLNVGVTLPNKFPLVNFSTILNNVPSIPEGLAYFARLGGGRTLFGLGMASAELVATMSRSKGQNLLRTEVRSSDGMPATFHVGDRYPILTSGYYGPASSSGAQAYRPPPSFNFEDLGLLLKITPHVHGADEVSLDVEAEFKVLAGQVVNGIPVISSRKVSSKIRLKNGEWGVLAGVMNASEARTISGIAALSGIPFLGPLVRRTSKNVDRNEVLIILKPKLLGLSPSEMPTRAVRTGSETRPITPL